jgi:hypothetical protein
LNGLESHVHKEDTEDAMEYGSRIGSSLIVPRERDNARVFLPSLRVLLVTTSTHG